MAKFGIEQTGMTAPGLGGAGFIAQGVEDRSGALSIQADTGLMADVGKAGIDAYKGYTIAEAEKQYNPLIEEGYTRSAANTIFQANLPPEKLNTVLQGFQIDVNKYQNALKQGVMSSAEFETRTTNILREAVNRNPGMIKELSEHLNNIRELSGLSSIIKRDEADRAAVAKGEKEALDYDLSIAKTLNVTVPRNSNGSVDVPKLRAMNAQVQGEVAIIEAADRKDKFTEDEFRNFGTSYATGKINKASDMAIQILNDPSIPYDKAIFSINNILDSVEQGFVSDPRVGRIIDKPSVSSTYSYLKNQITAIKSNLKGFASKEEAATYFKNSTNTLRDQQYQDLSKVVNPQSLDVISKLTSSVGVADFISKHPDLKNQLYDGISKLVDGLPTQGTIMYEKQEGFKAPAIQVFNQLAIDAGKPDGEKSITSLANIIKTISVASKNIPISKKYEFYGDYIKALGNPVNKLGISKLDDVAIGQATESLADYMDITTSDFLSTVGNYRDKNVQISLDMLPDGRISITTDSPQITNELNRKYIVRMNDSLNAYANLTNSTSSAIASKFYSDIIGIKPSFERISEQETKGLIKGAK